MVDEGSSPVKPLSIGGRKQLFVDDYMVAHTSGVCRRQGQVSKENGARPVMEPNEREYPLYFGVYSTVLRDDDRFKMWYLATNMPDYDVGYAESRDGIHWNRPAVSPDGTGNFVFRGHGFSCFIDPNEDDPEHRFKACYGPAGKFEKAQKAAHLAHSPDGVRWTPYNRGRAVLARTWSAHPQIEGRGYVVASDTHNQINWDGDAGVYRLFTRDIYDGPPVRGDRKISRGSRTMTNPDVKADPTGWTLVRTWEFDREGPDEFRRRQSYALTDWLYEGVHFALMGVMRDGGLIDCYIGTSRDAAHWDSSWVYAGQPFIPPGPAGSFDAAGAFPFSQIVTWKDRHWLHYGAMDRGHKDRQNRMSIGAATLRLDGFVSLEAGPDAGTVTTRPFVLEGRGLELNLDASRGEAAVEIQDAEGRALPGFAIPDCRAIRGVDALRQRAEWSGQADLGVLTGSTVRLHVEMRNAHLYAFQVRP